MAAQARRGHKEIGPTAGCSAATGDCCSHGSRVLPAIRFGAYPDHPIAHAPTPGDRGGVYQDAFTPKTLTDGDEL